jgi:hypothetical protein
MYYSRRTTNIAFTSCALQLLSNRMNFVFIAVNDLQFRVDLTHSTKSSSETRAERICKEREPSVY